jgi:hypothetical protein
VPKLLSVGAAHGLIMSVFQYGWGNGLLGFQQVDIIEAWVPLFLFAVLFASRWTTRSSCSRASATRRRATTRAASVYGSGNASIPRTSRRRLPEIPARTRESPQRPGRKALLSRGIPAYPRAAHKRHDRPVTPEVAGSSPVAPVESPANSHVVLSA